MVPGVICNYRRWVAKKCKFQSYMIAKTFENKIFLSSSHYPFTLIVKVLRFCQVAREGKVDQLQSLVELENLENIRIWINRWGEQWLLGFWIKTDNRLDEKENSPLHYAARYSHAEVVICYYYFHLLLSNHIINVISIKVIKVIKMSQMARELVRLGAEVDLVGIFQVLLLVGLCWDITIWNL